LSAAALAGVNALNGFLDMFPKQNTMLSLSGVGDAPEGNPYGMFVVPVTKGKLQKGHILITNWNDANGLFGQGHTITQLSPGGTNTAFATISPTPKHCGNIGVGLTMALVVTSLGYVIVGSTPVNNANLIAERGCLIVLDSNGNIVKTVGGPGTGVNGPWGASLSEFQGGQKVKLFVSMVLGQKPTTNVQVNQGHIVRYTISFSGGNVDFVANDIIAAGFPTIPAMITGGQVSPAGLVFDKSISTLFAANTLGSSIEAVHNASACSKCKHEVIASGGVLNLPIGINLAPNGNIIGADGGIGDLFEVGQSGDVQVTHRLVDNTFDAGTGGGALPGAGNLFNCIAAKDQNGKEAVFFVDDNLNNVQTLHV